MSVVYVCCIVVAHLICIQIFCLSINSVSFFSFSDFLNIIFYSHIPKAKATAIADTPELKRIAENTKIQSNVKYHADFEKQKGKLTQVWNFDFSYLFYTFSTNSKYIVSFGFNFAHRFSFCFKWSIWWVCVVHFWKTVHDMNEMRLVSGGCWPKKVLRP